MLYDKTVDDKLVEIELNSSRTQRSSGGLSSSRSTNSNSFAFSSYLQNPNLDYAEILAKAKKTNSNSNNRLSGIELNLDTMTTENSNTGQLTSRSLLLTNRTNKSVRFDDEKDKDPLPPPPVTRNSNIDENEVKVVQEKNKLDHLQNQAVTERYKTLTEFVSTSLKSPRDPGVSPFSLSLPLTPRSLDGLTVDLTKNPNLDESSFISKEMSKSLESLYKEHNEAFVNE